MSRLQYLSDVYGIKLVGVIEYSPYIPVGVDVSDSMSILRYIEGCGVGNKIQWVVLRLLDRDIRLEDMERVVDALVAFDRVKGRLLCRDINRYRSLVELEQVVGSVDDQQVISVKQYNKIVKLQGAEYIVDSDLKVLWIKTVDAARLYGSGTKWCTAARNNNIFDSYNNRGRLYIILAGDRKFQLHYQSDQFMDERDVAVTINDKKYLSTFDGWRVFLDILIEYHYGCYFGDCRESI